MQLELGSIFFDWTLESTSYKSVKNHIHGGADIGYHLAEIKAVEVEIVF